MFVTKANLPFPVRPARGFTLVEVMVGLLIGLIAMVVIFQVFQVAEARKRTTSAGSDAQISGTVAMYAIERDFKLAGYGFGTAGVADGGLLGCEVIVYDSKNPAVTFKLPLVPVLIQDGLAGAPDTITVLWGSSFRVSSYESFSVSTDDSKMLKYRAGFERGDVAIAAKNGVGCHMLEISDDTNKDQKTINHDPGKYIMPDTSEKLARYNNPVAPGMDFSKSGGFIFNMGQYPRANQWSVQNGKLVLADLIHYLDMDADGKNDTIEIADGVIDLQAQYGWDLNGDGLVADAEWSNNQPTTSDDWAKVRAVRVAILTRSGQLEKDYTAPQPTWGTATVGGCVPKLCFVMMNLDGTSGTTVPTDPAKDWRKYRYRVYENIIPFRNMIWGNS
jgi:type IV pilus assembly protein PilW